MSPDDEPTTEELRAVQSSKAREERKQAEGSISEDEAKTHDRRSEKAAYLAAKLAEKELSEEHEDA
jgi:hypothetical protein